MNIYISNYDSMFNPAMPVVEVTVRGTYANTTLTAIVDSGADATLIPLPALNQIKEVQGGWIRVKGMDGISRRIPFFMLELSLGTLQVGTIRVGGDKTLQQMILGRDVLNYFVVTLNGLANVVEFSD